MKFPKSKIDNVNSWFKKTDKRNMAIRVLFFFLLVFVGLNALTAQDLPENPPSDVPYTFTASYNHATLMGWQKRTEIQLLDRGGNHGGFVTDRGWMFNYDRRINDEYRLNRMNFLPTLLDDYIWFRSPNAARVTIADQDNFDMFTVTELQMNVEIFPKSTIYLYGYQESNSAISRLFFNLGYAYQIRENIKVGLEHTLGSRQTDLDIGIFGQYGDEQQGYIKFKLTALDYLNNFVYNALSTPGAEQEVNRHYYSDTLREFTNIPLLAQLSAVSPEWFNLRGEIHINYSNKSESIIESLNEEVIQYGNTTQSWFAGALLQYRWKYFTIGSAAQYLYAFSSRDSVGGSFNPNYETEQIEFRKGFFAIANASQITWDTYFWLIDFEDNQSGSRFTSISPIDLVFDHSETRIFLHNRIKVRPDYRGFIFGVEHIANLNRKSVTNPDLEPEQLPPDYDPLGNFYPDAFHSNNNRINLTAGYQLHPRSIVEISYGFDLDNDLHRFSGGQIYDTIIFRLDLRW